MSRGAIHDPPALTPVLYAAAMMVAIHAWHAGHAIVTVFRWLPLMYLGYATRRVRAADPNLLAIFPSHRAALLDMLPTLADPRVRGHGRSSRH